MSKMKNIGNNLIINNGDDKMEQTVLLAINKKMLEIGLITKEEKEAMDVEILREK